MLQPHYMPTCVLGLTFSSWCGQYSFVTGIFSFSLCVMLIWEKNCHNNQQWVHTQSLSPGSGLVLRPQVHVNHTQAACQGDFMSRAPRAHHPCHHHHHEEADKHQPHAHSRCLWGVMGPSSAKAENTFPASLTLMVFFVSIKLNSL